MIINKLCIADLSTKKGYMTKFYLGPMIVTHLDNSNHDVLQDVCTKFDFNLNFIATKNDSFYALTPKTKEPSSVEVNFQYGFYDSDNIKNIRAIAKSFANNNQAIISKICDMARIDHATGKYTGTIQDLVTLKYGALSLENL